MLFNLIPLDSINTNNTSTNNTNNNDKENDNDNRSQELLLDLNTNENESNNLLSENKTKNKISKQNEISITYKQEIPEKVEDRIICFSRRRKMPKKIDDLAGYFITFGFFVFFTILMTICLSFAKKIPDFSEFLKTLYNWIISFIWITSISCLICLTDAAFADPGRQRGTPIPKNKYEKAKKKHKR